MSSWTMPYVDIATATSNIGFGLMAGFVFVLSMPTVCATIGNLIGQ